MVQNTNQFNQTPEKGQLTADTNVNTFQARASSTLTGSIVPGQALTIVNVAGSGVTRVTPATAASDEIFGFAPYDVIYSGTGTNDVTIQANDMLKVATDNTVMYLEANAAVNAGAKLEYVPTGQRVATQSSGTFIGIALNAAAAQGDLIRVLIKTNNS